MISLTPASSRAAIMGWAGRSRRRLRHRDHAQLAGLIDAANPERPHRAPVRAVRAELDTAPKSCPIRLATRRTNPVEGIVHRYPDRVLLKAVSVCPVYCRFCFRREMVGPGR